MVSVRGRDLCRDLIYSIQNPAFGPVQVRRFTPMFLEKSLEVSTFKI